MKKQLKVVKKKIESFSGIYDESRICVVTNKDLNSISFANYDNDEKHMSQPWTLFMTPENAVKLAISILDSVK